MNFLYRMDGLRSFDAEWKHARWISWMGTRVPVLPIERILRSKQAVRRPKDLAHLPLLREVLRVRRQL